MTPTIQDWQRKLPLITEHNRDTDKVKILARYQHKPSATYFYVAQGKPIDDRNYLYWGFAVVPGRRFAIQLTVSSVDLETGVWIGSTPCTLDKDFLPGEWIAIKNYHFPPMPPLSLGRMNGRGRPTTHPDVLQ